MPDADRAIVIPPALDVRSMSVAQIASAGGPIIDELLDRARDTTRQDSTAAAEMLLGLLSNAVADFEGLCTSDPARFLLWAREREDWPAIYHRHPGLNRRTQETMKNIELGSRTELNNSNKSFNPDTPANRVVLDLYHLVKLYQASGRVPGRMVLFNEVADDKTTAKINEWCRTVAPTLPKLSRDTYEVWNRKTRPPFLLHYGDEFQDRPQFAMLVQGILQTNKHGKPSRAHRRSKIYDAIEEAWKSISAFPGEEYTASGK